MNRKQIEQINIIMCKITELYGAWAKRNKMSYNEMMTLYALNQLGECTQKQICDSWMIPKQTVNTSLKELEEQGYVELRQDCTDKRGKTVRFTEAGQEYVNQKLRGIYKIEQKTMEYMDANMREALVACNQKYLDAFEYEVNHE